MAGNIANYTGRLGIALARHGCANRPFYHFVIVPKTRNMSPTPFEVIGSYDPMPNERSEQLVAINVERLRFWLGQGAICSHGVGDVLGLVGLLPLTPHVYMYSWRKRKEVEETTDTMNEKSN